jgi:hypothetical protein
LVPLLWSPFSELCQPNKLFELVSGKRPVIVPRLQAIEESFDESCVMFFKAGDSKDLARCILELYDHPAKRERLVKNASHRYKTISWAHSKETYLRVVHSLVRTKIDVRDAREETKETHIEEIYDAEDSCQCETWEGDESVRLRESIRMRDW